MYFVSDRFGRFPVKPGMTESNAGNDGELVRGESSSFPSDGNDGTELGKQLGEILIGQPGCRRNSAFCEREREEMGVPGGMTTSV